MRTITRLKGTVSGSILMAVLAPPIMAQSGDEDDQGDNAFVMSEIVITARKVEERLQDVPLAISAFGEREMSRLGIIGAADIGALTPGLLYEKDFGRRFDRPVIRGQSNILGSANAASFIDGIFIPDSLFSTELAFVERVEVIKGPQSALYGRQTFSGAISYVTKAPSNEFEGELRLRAAEDEEFDILGLVSGPLVEDRAYFQFGANYYKYGGEYKNNAPGDPSDGRTIGNEETTAFSGKILLTPSENIDITLRMSYSKNDDGNAPIALQDSTFNNCFLDIGRQYFCGEVEIGPEAIGLNLDEVEGGGIKRSTYRGAATIAYRFADGYELTSITGYNDSSEERRFDADFQNFPGLTGILHRNDILDIESFSQEVRVASPQDQPFRWIAGAYYYDETRDEDNFRFSSNTLLDNAANEARNLAAFAFGSYDVTEALTLSAEVRIAEDKLRLVGGANELALEETFKSVNPRFTIGYKVNPDFLLFGVIARGNKPGGFNSNQSLPDELVAYDEETSWNYEVGAKTAFMDNRIQLNLSAYYIDWSAQQLTQNYVPDAGSPFSYVANAGALNVYGMEAEASFRISEQWVMKTSYAYTDPKFKQGTDTEVGTLFGDPSLVGKRPPNVAQHQLAVISDMNFAVSDDIDGFIVADASYRSSKYAQVINQAETGSRTVVNFRVGFTMDRYELSLFARNLLDNIEPVTVTRYIDGRNFIGFNPFATNRGFLAAIPRGRQLGIELRANF